MKIKKVKWRNHSILGDLELDFTNDAGIPFKTILFAGENGTGKTSILQTLSTFLNMDSFEPFDYIEYVIDNQIYKAIPQEQDNQPNWFFDIIKPDSTRKSIFSSSSSNRNSILEDPEDPRHYGCVFSKARADYKTQKITHTTSKTLDNDKYDIDNEDDFTSLKQLIVDIQNQDNENYVEQNKTLNNNPLPWPEFFKISKTFRFKNAFDNFFDNIEYEKVTDLENEKTILFKKNNNSISIDNLSTGEKQIVFRGIYLLKNSNNLKGSTIMIDEPELSMHPKWQQNILKYYKDLFTDADTQKAQLFLASHSEHVLKDALSDKENNLVILLWNDNGTVKAKRVDAPVVLPSITAAETNYLAFDIVSTDYHIELYGLLQDKTNNNTVKSCDDFIKNSDEYNPVLHSKISTHNTTTYETLSTFIRNAIHHPDPARTYTERDLRISIELLIKLINQLP
ncbi:AAA family ATPase [Chryseobacterium sp. RRHN12]|uniref:AAA family ATPase n=1 Tax=Chryseobacterium sp. RRHN12 TaxID=3437884 RepID=UPI003D9B1B94